MAQQPINSNFETQVLERLTQIKQDLEQLTRIEQDLESIKSDLKGWTTWLRFASGTVLFGVALTLIGLVLPIAIALWRQSLV